MNEPNPYNPATQVQKYVMHARGCTHPRFKKVDEDTYDFFNGTELIGRIGKAWYRMGGWQWDATLPDDKYVTVRNETRLRVACDLVKIWADKKASA